MLNLMIYYFQALVLHDPDIPCIYPSVFAHLNQVALSDGSFIEIKLRTSFLKSIVVQMVRLGSVNG